MGNDRMASMQRIVQEIESSRSHEPIDYAHMTAPCGIPCFTCYPYLANFSEELRDLVAEELGIPVEKATCKGCRDENGKPALLPMECNAYQCTERKGIALCSDCGDFPCDHLHPYADKAYRWHNTKVFSLCLIRNMGLERWAREKARSVRDVYYFAPLKL